MQTLLLLERNKLMVKRQSRLLSLVAITVLLLLLAFANTSCMNNASTLYSPNTGKVFEIYSTQNIYNLLKLDTRNGKIWQVQFSVTDDAPRVVVPLNQVDLSSDNGKTVGRFSLHPTQNMYNFILLDQIDGSTWQVQWSFEKNTRGIIPIN